MSLPLTSAAADLCPLSSPIHSFLQRYIKASWDATAALPCPSRPSTQPGNCKSPAARATHKSLSLENQVSEGQNWPKIQ